MRKSNMMKLNHTVIEYSNQWNSIALISPFTTNLNSLKSSVNASFADDFLLGMSFNQLQSKHI